MRRLLLLAGLLVAPMANAAVTLVFDQTSVTSWDLSLVTTADEQVAAVVFQIQSTSVADFTIAAGSNIESFSPDGFSAKIFRDDSMFLLLDHVAGINPINPGLLGTLTVAGNFTFLPDTQTGGTVQALPDFAELPYTVTGVTVQSIPVPTVPPVPGPSIPPPIPPIVSPIPEPSVPPPPGPIVSPIPEPNVSPIPEPSSILLALSGGLLVAASYKFRRFHPHKAGL